MAFNTLTEEVKQEFVKANEAQAENVKYIQNQYVSQTAELLRIWGCNA